MASTICALPWISASVRNNGDLRVCCQANVGAGGGVLRKGDGEPFNWSRDPLEQARNSELLKDIRSSMLKGEWHKVCERCRVEESASISSRRVRVNALYSDVFSEEHAFKGTRADGGISVESFDVHDLDVRFGNLCNLRCRMCGPTDSSAWYAEHVKLNGSSFQSSNGQVQIVSDGGSWKAPSGGFDWYLSDHVKAELEKIAPSVRQIYVVGGEPFLIQGHWDYLRLLVQSDRAKEVDLEYNTNLTRIPEDAWGLWREFKSVSLGVSVDGVGAVNDYIRFPSRFGVIEKNLERLDRAEGNIRVWLATTVSIYNVLHLPEFILWKVGKKFRRVNSSRAKPFITSHPLHKPECLNIKALPEWAKNLVADRYGRFLSTFELELREREFSESEAAHLHSKAETLLNSYLKLMYSEDLSRWLPEFAEYTAQLDALRSQSFADVVPEFMDLLQNETVREASP